MLATIVTMSYLQFLFVLCILLFFSLYHFSLKIPSLFKSWEGLHRCEITHGVGIMEPV